MVTQWGYGAIRTRWWFDPSEGCTRDRQGGSSWGDCAEWGYKYVDGHESVDFADHELALGVAGEALDAEVKPALGVNTVTGANPVFHTAQPILGGGKRTWNSDICLTSCMLPDSKEQSMTMYLSREPR